MPPTRGRRGLEVTVSLETSDLTGADVTAAEFVLGYNPAHVTPLGIEQQGPLTEGWLAASRDFGDAFKVALASATPASGAGPLVHLRLLIGLRAPDTVAVSISNAYLNADAVSVATRSITVDAAPASNSPPVAVAGDDFTVQVGEPFTLSAAASSDADGAISGYEWDLGDGHTSSGPAILHVYDWIGAYTVTLRVGDDEGAVASDLAIATVRPAEPATNPSGDPLTLFAGGGVYVHAPASVFRGGAMVAQAHRADAEALALASPPDGFAISLPALARQVTLTRDGAEVETVREAIEVELTFDEADLTPVGGPAVDPSTLAPFVVRDDGTAGMLREAARSVGSVTFATPRLGVMGLGVVTPGADLPEPDAVAAAEDVNADGLVNIIDLVTVARAFGRPGVPVAGSDINGDGVVNIFDLVTVASRFGQPAAGAPARSGAGPGRPSISIARGDTRGHVTTFDITADTLVGVGGYELALRIDPSQAELVDIEQGDALGPRAFWMDPIGSQGEHRMASVGLGPAESSGAATLARVYLRDARRRGPALSASAIQLRQVLLSDVVGHPMRHEIVPARRSSPEATTTVYANYPNPFNPETWIPFSLAESAEVTVRVYDDRGGLVRTLALGERLAGAHTAPGNAAYWDGTNETGEEMASGVYYYEVAAGSVRTTRRMLMVK